jgi:hypothetical protein
MIESWSEVRLGLMALGYNRILHVEIVCKSCGTWRGAIREEADTYPCPRCTSHCTLSLAVEGFSRNDLPEWQLIVKALSQRARQTIIVDDFLEYKGEINRNKRMRQHADTFAKKAFKRGRGLKGVVDLRSAAR